MHFFSKRRTTNGCGQLAKLLQNGGRNEPSDVKAQARYSHSAESSTGESLPHLNAHYLLKHEKRETCRCSDGTNVRCNESYKKLKAYKSYTINL